MNVLSLFDGGSMGQVALNMAGVRVDNYFASEIEKAAMVVTMDNYPNTIQIGDVRNVSYKDGVLTTENGKFNVGKIDLVQGGSPC
jgi:site-specific DNA-cytosine methylase